MSIRTDQMNNSSLDPMLEHLRILPTGRARDATGRHLYQAAEFDQLLDQAGIVEQSCLSLGVGQDRANARLLQLLNEVAQI